MLTISVAKVNRSLIKLRNWN